ncbi:MAG TPA: PLP-dependent aspartate aminotransferase family protein [Melioribacteraceae bacterium]|nr:PLP-dependent aspartate aminotransferase family protein [Melioribacteraceae bacterium]
MNELTQILEAIPVDPLTGSLAVPIYQTSTYVQESPGVNKGFDYTRTNNPTRKILETIIAQLEGGTVGLAFASGLSAIDSVVKLLKTGDEVLAVDDIYGGAFRLFTTIYNNFGITINFVDTTDVNNVKKAINEKTKLIWLESPTNPLLKISDIEEIAKIAKEHNLLLCVDNTFASPIFQNPLKLGADIVIHSATKYIGGHTDVLSGLVVAKDIEIGEKLKYVQNATGAVLSPFDSWLLIRSLETLKIRVEKHVENAKKIAEFLSKQPGIKNVYYPGLPAHKNYEIVKKQQKQPGSMISISFEEDTEEVATKFVTSTKLFKLAESLGGAKSLVSHPASMTHKSIPREKRLAGGITDSLVRLSVGLEDAEDLINDIKQAIEKSISLK